jgi:hypothetical protein
MKKIMFRLFISIGLLLFAQISVFACVCPDDPDVTTVEQEVIGHWKRAQVVFTGKVIEITQNPFQYRLQVETSWKGLLPHIRPTEILLVAQTADCEFPFKVGKKYLVYAYERNNKLTTSECSGNIEFEKASEELKILGKSASIQTNTQGATLTGNVYDHQGALIIGARIILVAENGRVYQSVTKEEGYQLNVPAGVYSVEIIAEHFQTFRISKYRITPSTKGKQFLDVGLTVSEPPNVIRIN